MDFPVFDCFHAFGHDLLFKTGLVVADVNTGFVLEFAQVIGQQRGAVVTGLSTQTNLGISKGGLDNQQIEFVMPIQVLPEGVIGGGIATEGKHTDIIFNAIPHARHNMIHRNHLNVATIQTPLLAWLHDLILQDLGMGIGDSGEIGPDDVIKNMRPQGIDSGLLAVDGDGFTDAIEQSVHQERDARQVIQMGMGEKDVPDTGHFRHAQITDTGAGIDQDVVIDHDRGRAQIHTHTTTATEYPYFHNELISLKHASSKAVHCATAKVNQNASRVTSYSQAAYLLFTGTKVQVSYFPTAFFIGHGFIKH